MKKRNWLMTIAFAVLSLTIISTCVIGSTYAKFVSKVGASGGAKAAGFSVTSTTKSSEVTLADEDEVVAPGETKVIKIAFTYYSQVDTVFEVEGESALVGVGAFEDWAAVKTGFATWLASDEAGMHKGATATAKEIDDTFELKFASDATGETLLTSTKLADAIAEAVRTATGCAKSTKTLGTGLTDAQTVAAMAKDAKEAKTVELYAVISWKSAHTAADNAWDTYLGKLVTDNLAEGWSGVTLSMNVTASQIIEGTAGD